MTPKKQVAAILLVGAVFAGIGVRYWLFTTRPSQIPSESVSLEMPHVLPVLVLIQPGTVVNQALPAGWSHSIIRSVLSLGSGDINTLPDSARKTATLFRTVVLAEVEPSSGTEPPRFQLRRVGVGLSIDREGRDVVISPDSLRDLGVEMAAMDRVVLVRAQAALGRGRLAAATPTFALYEAPVEFSVDSGERHESILLRYAIVVDPGTGAVRTLCWSIRDDATQRQRPENVRELPPGLVFPCKVHVLARRVVGNIAVSWKFAMEETPPGRECAPTAEFLRWSTLDAPEPYDALVMEEAIRGVLDAPGDRP